MSVSVITPVRNGERHLAETIESVLAGDVVPDEMIVVDDGSTDASASVAEDFGESVRVLREPPRGIAGALNAGVSAARCELVAFVDADDLWTPRSLEVRLGALSAGADLDGVFGRVECFHSTELTSRERATIPIPAGPQRFRAKGTLLVRRAALDRVGAFDDAFEIGDFIDWYARATEAGCRFGEVEDVVMRRRYHRVNHTRSRGAEGHADYVRLARAAIERRRAASS